MLPSGDLALSIPNNVDETDLQEVAAAGRSNGAVQLGAR